MAKGILLVAFDYTAAQADEFHDWYDLEHIPERQRVQGFGAQGRGGGRGGQFVTHFPNERL